MFLRKQKNILYKDWLYNWIDSQKPYIKESTYANYSTIIVNHIIPVLGNYKIAVLDHNCIQSFILEKAKNGRLDKKGGLSEKTIKDIVMIIKSTLKQAMNDGIIEVFNLDFNYPRTNKTNRNYILTQEDQKKIVHYILEHKTSRNIGILLSLYSGLRIGELCALKWEDIDIEKQIITINKTLQRIYTKSTKTSASKIIITSPKTKNALRTIPINPYISNVLQTLKDSTNSDESAYVLSCTDKYIEPRTYRKYFANLLIALDIDHIHFHSLRHTFATNCINLGVDYKTISEILGHSSINITLNLYVHPQMQEKRNCMNLMCKSLIQC